MMILNLGGTFNKRYNPLNGEMEVPVDNLAVESILKNIDADIALAGAIYKDSLDMDVEDRKMLTSIIAHSQEKKFIVVHGTDTMRESAEFLDTVLDDRVIILTGSMVPFEIEPLEATTNLSLSIGYLEACEKNGVYICMNGYIKPWNQISKNLSKGKFELVKG